MQIRIGEKIRRRRLASQLTQEELATRADLTKGFISQVERDRTSISLESLAMIVGALDTSLSEFFAEEEVRPVVFRRADRIEAAWGGAEKLELLIPGATNRKMDPIVVELVAGESFGCSEAHEGEEFGYVLAGTVELEVGSRVEIVRAGECFYYRANRSHRLANRGKTSAKVLWIATPPQM